MTQPRPLKKHQVAEAMRSALALHRQGDLAAARDLYRQVLQIEPKNADALHLLGLLCDAEGRLDRAIELLGKAVRLQPDFPVYHNSLGVALRKAGRPAEARRSLERAVALRPGYAEAYSNLGNLCRMLGQPAAARTHLERALELEPGNPLYLANLGGALADAGLLLSAVDRYEQVLARAPEYREAAGNLSGLYSRLGRPRESLALLHRLLETAPADDPLVSDYLLTLNYLDDCSGEELAAEHRRLGARLAAATPVAFPLRGESARPLRIGYVSPDFHRHPVGFLIEPVLAAHDRTQFEPVCYQVHGPDDDQTARLRQAAAGWRDARGWADGALTARIREDRIDILVDLAGHTAYNRLAVFAAQPAPVRASWLGYVTTTGLPAMDYFIGDPFTVPAGDERLYRETVLRLPGCRFCFAPPAGAPPVSPLPALARDGVTFGSFNNLAKVSDEVIAVWAALLQRVPGSRLLLKWRSLEVPEVRQYYEARFAARGIAAGRLELRGFSPHGAQLAEYGEVDLALDPFPFSGGMTSLEALWMGVPVLTLANGRPAGMQTASFLAAAGLDRLVARDVDDYLARGAALAADLPALAALRASLRERLAASPLCDCTAFTADLERLFREMWRRWCAAPPA